MFMSIIYTIYYFMTNSPLLAPSRVPEVISAPSILDYSNSTLPGVTIFIWSRKQFCLAGTESAKYKVAVLVLSAPKNREKRQNIRKLQLPGCHLQVFSNRSIKQMGDNFTITAWKSFDICVGWPLFVQFLFLIGQTGNSSLEEILHKVLINLTNHPMITLWSF